MLEASQAGILLSKRGSVPVKAQSVIYVLWVSQLILKGLLVTALISRRAYNPFPVFTALGLFNLFSGLLAFATYKHAGIYVYVFIVNECISVLLGLAVSYEIFAHLFVAQHALRKLAQFLFGATLIGLAVLSFTVIYTHTPGLTSIRSGILLTDEAARALEVGLLMFLFVCSSAFGLQWRQPVFGVALGLGFFTTVQLIIATVAPHLHGFGTALGAIGILAFDVSIVIWIAYLLVPEREVATEMPDRSQLEQWNRAVMELIHQ